MNAITDIKCPICRDRISGRTQDELNDVLRAHLAETHQITRLSEDRRSGALPSEPERDISTWSGRDPSMLTPQEVRQREDVARINLPLAGSESRIERQVETFSGREPTGEGPESARVVQENSQWKYPRMETREEREVGTWRSESRYRPSEKESGLQQGSSEWRGTREGRVDRTMSDARHGGTVHRMFNRREMTIFMDCPLCGNPVYGSDDEDLSDELRFHFKDYHQIKRS